MADNYNAKMAARFPTIALRLPSAEFKERAAEAAASTGVPSVGVLARLALIEMVERIEQQRDQRDEAAP